MKFSIILLFLFFSFSNEWFQKEIIPTNTSQAVHEPYCPPEHEKTRQLLKTFLTSEAEHEQKQRQDLQTQQVQADDIVLLTEKNDKEVCREIRKKFPWEEQREILIRAYYKTEQYYFVVHYNTEYSEQDEPEYGIHFTGHFITLLDKQFKTMGAAVMQIED